MNKPYAKDHTTACLSDEQIELFVKNQLSRDELSRIESHLDGCDACEHSLSHAVAPATFWSEASGTLRTGLSSAEKPTASRSESSKLGTLGTGDLNSTTRNDSLELTTANTMDARPIPLEVALGPTDDPEMLGRIGPYEISGVIGRGGMGIVLKGWDRSLDRFVAIKVLQPAFAHQAISRHRFAREAKAAAGVLHDNVIPIYGVDEHNHLPYLVMPYIKGESLERRIQRRAPLSLEEMLEIALQISRGLEAAHQQGLVHRDIKPANILLPESVSRVVITDFGLATALDEASLTRSSVLVGTPAYMSPEQVRGEPVDGRSDLFSLGSSLYAMASGHPPFRASSTYSVLRRITDQPHRPLIHQCRDLPLWFSELVDRLLEKDPAQRFASAAELAEHLESCLAHLRQPHLTNPPPRLRTSHKLKPAMLGRVAVIGLVAVTSLLGLTYRGCLSKNETQLSSDSAAANVDEVEWSVLREEIFKIESELESLNQELKDEDLLLEP